MDFSWISNLSPIAIAELLLGLFAFVILAKHTGLSISRNGFRFKSFERAEEESKAVKQIREAVHEIKESDVVQAGKIDNLSFTLANNVKDTLRLTFYNTALSVPERLVAGKRYIERKGNGETEKAINELAAENPDIWAGILAVTKGAEK
jgi:hypothetical protein